MNKTDTELDKIIKDFNPDQKVKIITVNYVNNKLVNGIMLFFDNLSDAMLHVVKMFGGDTILQLYEDIEQNCHVISLTKNDNPKQAIGFILPVFYNLND